MNLSIIIPTYKRESILKETVLTILNFYPKEKFEIKIVNDDNGAPLELEFDDERVEVLQNQAKGAAAARNLGVKHAAKSNLLFIDDDIVITEDHLQNHLNTLSEYPNGIVTANRKERQDLIDLFSKTSFGRYKYKHDYIWHEGFVKGKISDRYSYIDGAATFSCSMRKSTFEVLGGFDEKFPYAGSEDYDLFERAKKQGHKLIFDTQNICYHNEPYNAEMSIWMNRHYRGVASFILLCEKHPELKQSSRYTLYQPITKKDTFGEVLFKTKASFLGTRMGRFFTDGIIWVAEKSNLSDRLMSKLYNARFISAVKKGFKDFNYLIES
ncbi:glycosyltransferase [Ekhidna sp.]|uniref:glycosyltransferase family 2 protein n=1 Tax=Ekhidna sp. TaxID=2608089 RepID=UPI003298002E